MIIKLNEKELNKCKKLLDVKEKNISAAEIYIDYLNNHYNDIKKIDIDTLNKKYNPNVSFYKSFLKKLDIDENDPEYLLIEKNCKINEITCLNVDVFNKNKFYKQMGQIKGKLDDWQFVTLKYKPFEGFVSNELEIDDEYFAEHTPLSYFESEFPYLAVIQGDQIWMSVIPHEINTMIMPIENANGKVLILGLGLGYYLFNILEKNDVISVDIVEKDPRIVELFNKFLLSKMPHLEKIKIIIGDGIEYLKNCPHYDYVFTDIYHNVGDGEMLYLKVKDKEVLHPNTKFDYWIETSILAMLRRQTLTVFEEAIQGYTEEDYKKFVNENDQIINAIYYLTKNITIDSFDKLHTLLTEDSLKKMAKQIVKIGGIV